MNKYLEAGKAVNTHGVDGKIKLECWCDSEKVLASLGTLYIKKGDEYIKKEVEKASVFKQWVLVKLRGCDSFEEANSYRERIFYADRDDLPIKEGAMFIADMIGLPVKDIDTGEIYGTLSDVLDGAAGDIYEVKTEKGTVLIPAVKEFIKETSEENGIIIKPIPGMFDGD